MRTSEILTGCDGLFEILLFCCEIHRHVHAAHGAATRARANRPRRAFRRVRDAGATSATRRETRDGARDVATDMRALETARDGECGRDA